MANKEAPRKGKHQITWLVAVCISLFLFVSGCSIFARAEVDTATPKSPSELIYSGNSGLSQSLTSETTIITSTPTPTPSPSPTPTAKEIVVSFLGDCTLGQNKDLGSAEYSFTNMIGTNYAYPFMNAVDVLGSDDLTLANLEGPLTESTEFREKEIVFKGSPDYVDILSLGSVEAVNLANNHAYDYWDTGLSDTKKVLEGAGILWSDSTTYAIYEVDGVKIGMAGFTFPWQLEPIYEAIDSLRADGCEIVIVSIHTGVERMYEPESVAVNMAHDIIDYGADIYVGHHPHRLQPIEYYNGKYILYSLSNFVFGGQPWLTDPDTAIVQCTFTVDLGELIDCRLNVIPYSMTTTFPGNDYCPIPYELGSDEYYGVLEKLRWSESPE